LGSTPRARPLVHLGAGRWVALAGVVCVLAMLLGVPLGSLVRRLGATAHAGWSPAAAAEVPHPAAVAHGPPIRPTVVAGACAGGVASTLAVLACWLARRDRWIGAALVGLTAAAWAVPGPVVGVALKQAVGWMLDVEDRLGTHVVALLLYDGPSPLPA